jgi:hypothetical protein
MKQGFSHALVAYAQRRCFAPMAWQSPSGAVLYEHPSKAGVELLLEASVQSEVDHGPWECQYPMGTPYCGGSDPFSAPIDVVV